MAFLDGDAAASVEAGRRALRGDALALLAGAAWGATTVTIRCPSLAGAPATETLLYQLLGAFALLLPTAWLSGRWHFEPSVVVWAHLGCHFVVGSALVLIGIGLVSGQAVSGRRLAGAESAGLPVPGTSTGSAAVPHPMPPRHTP